MILQGNQRGGAKNLALHLLKDENEHVEVHELRGFVSDNLVSALNEAYAVSRGTKAKQFLYSLSLNPPKSENVSIEDFENAIAQVEEKLGLKGQPRAIVFHEKQGRRHAHAVWSRIDGQKMKAIELPFTKLKLKEVSRDLYLQHNWQMPRGFLNSQECDPKNFTLQQWQQAKRTGKDPRQIKATLQDCWAISDTQGTFQQALRDRGYTLARGDRRGFVAMDHHCEVYAISKKWIGKSAKEVRARLAEPDALPTVDVARSQIAGDMAARLSTLQKQQATTIHTRLSELERKRVQMVQTHQAQRRSLEHSQQARQHLETRQRQSRYSTGFRGLLDRVTGKRHRIKAQNEREAQEAQTRDRQEKDQLIFNQLNVRRVLQVRIDRLHAFKERRGHMLSQDIEQFGQVQRGERERLDPRGAQPQRGPELSL
ncbi:Uncharacterised protein [Halioglobus japonicus]|nr:Uncharacterised protein [Halioglobus japonicus]